VNKILAVIRREFIERVRTRAFLLGTFLLPLMIGVFGYLPQLLIKRDVSTRGLVVINSAEGSATDRVVEALRAARIGEGDLARPRFTITVLPAGGRTGELRDSIVRTIGLREGPPGAPDGLLVITESSVEEGKVTYLGSNVTSIRDMSALERILGPVLREERLHRVHADSAVLRAAELRLKLDATKVTEGKPTGQSAEAAFWLAYIVNLVMYVTLLLYGMQVMTAVVEEKSNRIVEVLISSLTPFQLLLGKVIGVGAVGLVQLGIWGATGFYLTSMLGSRTTGMEGMAADGAPQAISMPQVSVELVLVILLFFLLGFFLYSALYAAIGSMCTTTQEAQQANTPVTMMIAVGMISMFGLINEPSGTLARVLTFIPFFTPIVMPVRYAIAPMGMFEVLLAALDVVLGILAVTWLAGRIYRVGILSYGKKPSFKELWGWVRTR
jgi:ABC-2 type transport system permease protein